MIEENQLKGQLILKSSARGGQRDGGFGGGTSRLSYSYSVTQTQSSLPTPGSIRINSRA